ncbi:MAG: hypothetical protein HYR74_10845 [Candidatus Eisenbacteria bacterium]|nr:hypothetical protein [Candidatus Eisenbacteria bacterium]
MENPRPVPTESRAAAPAFGDAVAAASRAARAPILGPLLFLLVIAVLATIALVPTLAPPRLISGLPSVPRVDQAIALVRGRLAVPAGGLRFASALLGERVSDGASAPGSGDLARATDLMRTERDGGPRDARVIASLAALELAALRLEAAERRYREALDISASYPEARLGLGVVLAIRAEAEADPSRSQGLRLRAIAQFAAVPEDATEFAAALFDRALVLDRAGRHAEALRLAGDYWRRDPAGRWADALRAALAHE